MAFALWPVVSLACVALLRQGIGFSGWEEPDCLRQGAVFMECGSKKRSRLINIGRMLGFALNAPSEMGAEQ